MDSLYAHHRLGHAGRYLVLLALVLGLGVAWTKAHSAGYDENTEVVLTGWIHELCNEPHLGLQCFTLKSRSRIYRILTAPPWFMRGINYRLARDHKIEVVGSKFYGCDGSVYVLARSLRLIPTGTTVLLRDQACRPVWRNTGDSESSCLQVSTPDR